MTAIPASSAPPRHVAIIMDGNGRWAQQLGKPRHAGHRAGVKAVRSSVEAAIDNGVEVLTLFAFSSENWNRPQQEVGLLMELFLATLRSEVRSMNKNGIRLKFIGDLSTFSERLRGEMTRAEQQTAGNERITLNMAVSYGGRWDIANAARELALEVAAGTRSAESVDETAISEKLSTYGQPMPDLFIRTGGELRISNFLLWQLAYAELYFSEKLWPDFSKQEFARAVEWFHQRERRFGMTGEQVAGESATCSQAAVEPTEDSADCAVDKNTITIRHKAAGEKNA